MILEYVYKTRDNENSVQFSLESTGEEIDFSAVTRMVLILDDGADNTTTVDSDTDPGAIDWISGATGEVIFTLGDLTIDDNSQMLATLVAYDPSHTNGQTIVHDRLRQLSFVFYD